jgi:hypothetical protein
MMTKSIILTIASLTLLLHLGCRSSATNTPTTPTTAQQPQNDEPGPLPEDAYKAELAFIDPPAKLRVGQSTRVQIKIKNNSSMFWWSRGGKTNNRNDNKFYIAAGDRWLKSDGSLLTDMDGRIGISKDLNPGEETVVSLLINAPKEPGDYELEIDLVQEAVTWFSDKGSPTIKTKVKVVK